MGAVSSPNDDELFEAAKSGDRHAFRVLVDRYQPILAVTVMAMLKSREEVQDVLQDVFVQFYMTLDKYRGDASLKTYLNRIAVNKSLDLLRKRKRHRQRVLSTEAEYVENVASGEDESGQFEVRDAVWKSIDRLTPNQRAVVVLRLIEGYSTEETAKMLGVRYGTVLSRLSRAMNVLRNDLGSMAGTVDPLKREHED